MKATIKVTYQLTVEVDAPDNVDLQDWLSGKADEACKPLWARVQAEDGPTNDLWGQADFDWVCTEAYDEEDNELMSIG